jgi:hypothetical protein
MTLLSLISTYRTLWFYVTLGFSIILLGLVVLAVQISSELKLLESQTQQLYLHPFQVNSAASNASLMVAEIRIRTLQHFMNGSAETTDESLENITFEFNNELSNDLKVIEENFLGDLSKVMEARQLLETWTTRRKKFDVLIHTGNKKEALIFLRRDLSPIYVELKQRLNYIRDFSSNKVQLLTLESQAAANTSQLKFQFILITLFILTTIAGALTLALVLRQVKRRDAQLKREHEVVEHKAHFDELTNLPNRTLIYDRLKQALLSAKRNRSDLALLFMDLDGFKKINDTLGHHCGDILLKEVAKRLAHCIRESDTVGRSRNCSPRGYPLNT